jgi:hypothetical protein
MDSGDRLGNQLQKYFALVYVDRRYSATNLRSQIDTLTLVHYGRFRLAGDGDRIRTKKALNADPLARDNSFVKVSASLIHVNPYQTHTLPYFCQYNLLPDRNAAFRNRPDEPFRQTHYGQVLDVYYIEFVMQKPRPE